MMTHVLSARDLRDPRLDPKGCAVLMNLATRADVRGWCNPSVRTIALDTALSQKSVSRALAALGVFGYVRTESGKSDGRASDLYLVLPPWPTLGHTVPNTPARTGRGVGQTTPPGSVTESHTRKNSKEGKGKEIPSVSVSPPARPTPTPRPKRALPTRDEAVKAAYDLGCPYDEAERFYRYNESRSWRKLGRLTVRDLARSWTEQVSPTVLADERQRRLEAKRRAEEEALRRRIAAEQSTQT